MKRDIAIIGVSGKFPKSDNVRDFWNNLIDEKELIHFFSDQELISRGIEAKELNTASFVKAASFIDSYNSFDYSFFKYTPDEAKIMNPQTRMMHQLVWEGLEDAGCNLDNYNRKSGIFLGANRDLNWSVYATLTDADNVDAMTKAKITNPNFMASLIAYKFNLNGPCYFIDTACSTSLSTTHLACRSLLFNECGIAIAGGVRLLSHHDNGYKHQEGTIVSKDGHVRSFDADASGTIFCDGAGVVVLKKLEEALKDKDHIYAVIKSTAMNNDGNTKGGYTMPSVYGQSQCIKLAHKIAGVKPTDITYVETHGTATKIGDPIEIESLNKAFNNDTTHKCAIGTVKSNVGHADEAAGVLGLIKTSLSLKHKILPASLHYTKANPSINFKNGPFYVNTSTAAWNRINDKPLMAGISSFGIGGTNVHLVLQEALLSEETPIIKEASYLIRYSANTISSLEKYEISLREFIQENPEINLSSLAYTLQVGRKQFGLCKTFEVENKEELLAKLSEASIKIKKVKEKQKLVFMFSGQGSQYSGMGKFLYENFSSFRKILDHGFAVLQKLNREDYSKIFFDENDSNKINETIYTQPILFLFEYALGKFLLELGLKPDAMIGHSLGEYVAATLSGVFSFEDALYIMCRRAALMYGMPKGSMLSIGSEVENIDKELLANVSIAAINAPQSFVVSGTDEDINRVEKQLEEKEIQYVKLKTSHAFHSKMMEGIIEEFKNELSVIKLNTPNSPFVSNKTGTFITKEEATSPAYWADHITGTVQFKEGIQFLQQNNNALFLEVGPGRTLTTFFNQCNTTKDKNVALNCIRHPKETISERTHFLNFLGDIWQYKFDIDWKVFYQDHKPSKISIPTYCFDTYDFPTKVSIDNLIKKQNIDFNTLKEEHNACVPSWRLEPKAFKKSTGIKEKTYVFFYDENELSEQLKNKLEAEGVHLIFVKKGDSFNQNSDSEFQLNPAERDHFEALKDVLNKNSIVFDKVVFCWGNEQTDTVFVKEEFSQYNYLFSPVLEFLRVFEVNTLEHACHIVLITDNNFQITGADKVLGTNNHTGILLRVLVQEAININATHLDVSFKDALGVDQVFQEMHVENNFYKVAYRNGKRWIPYYEVLNKEVVEERAILGKEGVYLLTGDLGPVEFELINHIKEKYNSNVYLVGKNIHEEKYAEKIKRLETSMKGSFSYTQGDVSDYESLSTIITGIELEYGEIKGIIHSARFVSREYFLASSTSNNSIHNHYSIKVGGLLNLYKIFKNKKLGFVKVLSSLSGILGGVSFGAYATSNALLDEVAIGLFSDLTNLSVFNLDKLGEEKEQISTSDIIENFERSFLYKGVQQFTISLRNLNAFEDRAQNVEKEKAERFELNRTQLDSEFIAARTDTEECIVGLFEELFGQTGVGVEDDFFVLGGDSLKGISLMNKINKEFSIKISLADFFNNPTVTLLASLIDNRKWLSVKPTTKTEIFI